MVYRLAVSKPPTKPTARAIAEVQPSTRDVQKRKLRLAQERRTKYVEKKRILRYILEPMARYSRRQYCGDSGAYRPHDGRPRILMATMGSSST
jgi:hypothetical protein